VNSSGSAIGNSGANGGASSFGAFASASGGTGGFLTSAFGSAAQAGSPSNRTALTSGWVATWRPALQAR